jgi:elongation factor 1-delta
VVSNMNQVEETPKINDVKEFTEVVIDNKDIIEKVIEQIKEPVKEIKCKLPDLDTVVKTKDALCTGMTGMTISGGEVSDVAARLGKVESENTQLRTLLTTLESRLNKLEGGKPAAAAPAPAKPVVKAPEPAKKVEEDDDDFDMFGDEEDDEEVAKRNAERIAEYHAKKAAKGKPAVIAKSSILLDCKPWDDETDMKELENKVRSIEMEGLKWNQNSKLVTVAYGLKKLQIGCVIVDDLVSTEALEELILEFEDHCQSVDIAAFNKI